MRIVIELFSEDDGEVLHREKTVIIKPHTLKCNFLRAQTTMFYYPIPNGIYNTHPIPLPIPELRHETIISESDVAGGTFWRKVNLRILIFTIKEENVISINQIPESLSMMLRSLKKLYEAKRHTDITVKCSDGIELELHKFPLVIRSAVFDSMFSIDMTEKQRGVVEIKDFDSNVMNEVFRFIYCNEVHLTEEIVGDVLHAAKRYEIAELPEICAKYIIDNFEGVDIWGFLQYSHVYELMELFRFIAGIFYA